MTITAFSEIDTKKPLTPPSEVAVHGEVTRNRRLYNNDLGELMVDRVSQNVGPININLFRRVADFYGEFMLAERPDVVIDGNPRMTEAMQPALRQLWPEVQCALVDCVAYGEGAVGSHPLDPLAFQRYERDRYYERVDGRGVATGHVMVRIRKTSLTEGVVDVFKYDFDPGTPNTWQQFVLEGMNLGTLRATYDMPVTAGPQLVMFSVLKEKNSFFDDMKSHVGEMARTLTNLAKTISRNARPHLFGPDGALRTDPNGNVQINVEGEYFALQPGDLVPGYLQWDSNIEAVQWDYNKQQQLALMMAGLNNAQFDPEIMTGVLTGVTLRRLLLPFVARLQHVSRSLEEMLFQSLSMWNMNRLANGLEGWTFQRNQLQVEWRYAAIFRDEDEEGDNETDASAAGTTGNPNS